MNRLLIASGSVLAIALAVGIQACSSSDTGSSTAASTGGAGNTSTGGAGNSPGAAGTPSSGAGATSVAGTGGAPSGIGGTGGTAAMTAGTGGAVAGGGASGSTSTGGASGGTATGGDGGGSGTIPTACDATVAKAGPCTTAGSICSKTCGPDKTGYKTETCTAGAYAEGVCTFPPTGTYACYKKTLPLTACAGAATAAGPAASSACTADPCVPCGPAYEDSKMTAKMGACVCTANKWSCASDAEWPPQ